MNTTAIFTFLDRDNNKRNLTYRIYNHNLSLRWIELLRKNRELNNTFKTSWSNKTPDDLPSVREEMNNIIRSINKTYTKELPLFANVINFETDVLNYLHEEFEVYGDVLPIMDRELDLAKNDKSIRAEYFKKWEWWSEELHDNFLRLNVLIHLHEDLNFLKDERFNSMSLLWDYYPAGIHEDIKPLDKLFLTTNFQWGGLYLGYNTLGKDWLAVCKDNDIEVVERQATRPQTRFAAESWLHFGENMSDNGLYSSIQFSNWLNKLPVDLRDKIPNNVSELNLGRFCVGELVIDSQFLKINPNVSQWKWDINLQNTWNKEVFSTFRDLKDVTILTL